MYLGTVYHDSSWYKKITSVGMVESMRRTLDLICAERGGSADSSAAQ